MEYAAMGRHELARYLYVYEPEGPDVTLTAAEQSAGAYEWDTDQVKTQDRLDCYARADEILSQLAAEGLSQLAAEGR